MKNTLLVLLLCLAVSFTLAACTGEPADGNNAQIANPWTDHAALADAEQAAGFAFGLPETIGGEYTAKVFRVLGGENPMIEIAYEDAAGNTVTVRKAAGEDQDISGVYGLDAKETEQRADGRNVTYLRPAGDESAAVCVIFGHEGYAWSVYAPEGFAGDTCEDFLAAVFG